MTVRPSSELAVGQKVAGRYVVLGLIAKGGMGLVYAGKDSVLGRSVAIKVASDLMLAEPDCVARFEREAKACVELKTPRVPVVYDVGTLPSGNPFLVMERLEGKDLQDLEAQSPELPIELAIDLVIQICEALGEVHARGIIHRDLKPANVFVEVGPDGAPFVKILDFGLAKSPHNVDLTQPGLAVGTPEYMAPERMNARNTIDARADVWSIGVILYRLLTRESLFGGEAVGDVVTNILSAPIPRVSSKRPAASAALDEVVLRCLDRDRTRRIQDVAALAAALAPFGPPDAIARAEKVARTMARVRKMRLEGIAVPTPAISFTPRPSDPAPEMPFARVASETLPEGLGLALAPPRSRSGIGAALAAAGIACLALVVTLTIHQSSSSASVAKGAPSAAATAVQIPRVARPAAIADDDIDMSDVRDVGDVGDDDNEATTTQPEPWKMIEPLPSAQKPAPKPLSRSARVTVKPRGAKLVLDHVPNAGVTLWSDGVQLPPGATFSIAPGAHSLKAVAGGQPVWAAKITASEGETVRVKIPDAYAHAYD